MTRPRRRAGPSLPDAFWRARFPVPALQPGDPDLLAAAELVRTARLPLIVVARLVDDTNLLCWEMGDKVELPQGTLLVGPEQALEGEPDPGHRLLAWLWRLWLRSSGIADPLDFAGQWLRFCVHDDEPDPFQLSHAGDGPAASAYSDFTALLQAAVVKAQLTAIAVATPDHLALSGKGAALLGALTFIVEQRLHPLPDPPARRRLIRGLLRELHRIWRIELPDGARCEGTVP